MRAPDEYDELAVTIEPAGDRSAAGELVESPGFTARILWSPYDGGKEVYEPPYAAGEVPGLLGAVCDEVRGGSDLQRKTDASRHLASSTCPPAEERGEPPSAREVGSRLFQTLFSGKIEKIFRSSWHAIEVLPRRGLRLRLVFDPRQEEVRHLAALPWELLRSEETADDFSLMVRTPIIRHLQVPRLNIALPVKPPLRVLVAAPNPKTQEQLNLAKEIQGIRDAWGSRYQVDITWLKPVTIDALYEAMSRETFHVLHFMGHSRYDRTRGEGKLIFEHGDGETGLTGRELAIYLKENLPRLVVLNSCDTAQSSFANHQNPYTGVATALILGGVTAVVANQFPITDRAAIAFSSAFYKSLAVGDPVDAAVVDGRLGILRNRPSSLEWVTPVLFMRSRDGRIFEFAEEPERVRKERTVGLKLGIRSFSNQLEDMEQLIRPPENLKDLLPYFDSDPAVIGRKKRHLRSDVTWQGTIFPQVRDFLLERTRGESNVYLHMDAHLSIAFAAGYVLDSQCGFGITVRQRTPLGNEDWRKPERDLSPSDALWGPEDSEAVEGGGDDVAVAISVTHDVLEDVKEYVRRSLPAVGRILIARLSPKPNSTGLRNATQAFHLAQALKERIRQRSAGERKGTLHVFSAAPNGFVFFLAQQARTFGKTVLYEHDFERGGLGAYSPSLTFPPPAENVLG